MGSSAVPSPSRPQAVPEPSPAAGSPADSSSSQVPLVPLTCPDTEAIPAVDPFRVRRPQPGSHADGDEPLGSGRNPASRFRNDREVPMSDDTTKNPKPAPEDDSVLDLQGENDTPEVEAHHSCISLVSSAD